MPKKGAWTVCRFKGRRGLGKKEGGDAFEGGLIPQCTLCNKIKMICPAKKNVTYVVYLTEYLVAADI